MKDAGEEEGGSEEGLVWLLKVRMMLRIARERKVTRA